MSLNVSTFFTEKHLLHPLSKELDAKERALAMIASIAFGLLTLGLVHAVFGAHEFWINRIVTPSLLKENQERCAQVVAAEKTDRMFQLLIGRRDPQLGALTRKNLPDLIQNELITPFYSQSLPARNEVEVTIPEGMEVSLRDGGSARAGNVVRWVTLTRESKIAINNHYAHAHGQLSEQAWECWVDQRIFGGSRRRFLPNDPRPSHGCDHAIRASLWAGVFGYLYGKYHPDIAEVTEQNLLLAQFVAAGHDCGRQTEGTDIDDERSADRVVAALRKMGVTEDVLDQCRDAIANKDGPIAGKSLIARCVQNADCAEFARLLLHSPAQSPSSFEQSRDYLDIAREFHSFAREGRQLKDGYTHDQFQYELDALRKEMNLLIYRSHQKRARRIASSPAHNYYRELLFQINEHDYPLLNRVLKDRTGIFPNQQEGVTPNPGSAYSLLVDRLPLMSQAQLTHMATSVQDNVHLLEQVQAMQLRHREELAEFDQQVDIATSRQQILKAYGALSPGARDARRMQLIEALNLSTDQAHSTGASRLVAGQWWRWNPIEKRHALLDLLHEDLRRLHRRSNGSTGLKKEAKNLRSSALRLKRAYLLLAGNGLDPDPRVLTTIALAYEQSAQLYLEAKMPEQARATLGEAATLPIHDRSPFRELERLFGNDFRQERPLFLDTDCGFCEHRRLRIVNKVIDGVELVEFRLEIPHRLRERVGALLESAEDCSLIDRVETGPLRYPRKDFGRGEYDSSSSSVTLGEERRLIFEDDAVVSIGTTSTYYNQYHEVKVTVPRGTSKERLQEIFATAGLPMILMDSRPQDLYRDGLGRMIKIRYPGEYFRQIPVEDPEVIYNRLSPEQKQVIDADMRAMRVRAVGTDQTELVHTELPEELWLNGGRAFFSFINGGTLDETARVLTKILGSGLLSSTERWDRGILGAGCAPVFNAKQGSANQAFVRLLTKQKFEDRFSLRRFPINGSIGLIFDIKAIERMPYSYLEDLGGRRNPQNLQILHWPEKQLPQLLVQGASRARKRPGLTALAEGCNNPRATHTETMFDQLLSADYLRRIVVWTEEARQQVIGILKAHGIFTIYGTAVEDFVVAGDKLDPEWVDNFEDEVYPGMVQRS